MATLSNLVVKFGFDPSGFNKGIDSATDKLKATGGQFRKIGLGMSAAFTAPALLAGGALLKIGDDFDSMVDTIRIGTGKTGAELDGLAQDALRVFESIPTSMDMAGEAITQLAQKTDLTGTALQDLARNELELARITGTDLNSVIESTTDVFNSWGIATEDQIGQLDKLMRASQASGVPVDVLATQLAKFGPTLRNMGLDIDESTALLASFAKAGLDVDVTMAGLKKAFQTFTDAGVKDPAAALTSVFDQIKNAPDDLTAAQIAFDTFGAKAGGALTDAIRSGAVSYDQLLSIIQDGDETVLGAAAATNDWRENLQILANRITVKLIPAANYLFAKINEGIPIITRWAERGERLLDWLNELSPTAKKVAVGFAIFLAAIGPILIVIGTLISIAAPAVAAITAIGGAIATVAGLVSLPLLPIIAIIAAIVLLTVAWKKNWFDIQGRTKTAVAWITKAIDPVLDVIKILGEYWHDVATNKIQPGNLAKLPGWLQPIAWIMGRLIKTVRVFVKTWQDKGFLAALKVIPMQIRALGRAFANLMDKLGLHRYAQLLKKDFYLIADIFKNVVDLVNNIIHGRWKNAWGNLVAIATDVVKMMVIRLKAIPFLILDVFDMIPWGKVGSLLVKGISIAAKFLWDKGIPWMVAAQLALLGAFYDAGVAYLQGTIIPWVKKLPGKMAELIGAGGNLLYSAGSFLFGMLKLGLSIAWTTLWTWIKDAAKAIVKPFVDMYSTFYAVGASIINGITQALSDGWQTVKAWIQKIIDGYNSVASWVPGMDPIGGGGDAEATTGIGGTGGRTAGGMTVAGMSAVAAGGGSGSRGVNNYTFNVSSNASDPVAVASEVSRIVLAEIGRVEAGVA